MVPRPSQAPDAFETPRLEVRWQGRRANFLESLRAAFLGPRAPREIDPSDSFFRLRIAPGRPPGRGIAGSFLWHAILLSISIPVSQLAEPKAKISLPQIEITWYGPATDVAPVVAPKPKEPKPAPRPKPKPRREIVARAYNPKITVIFHPPHPDNTRQVLVEPEAPPEMPKSLPALPNVIRWTAVAPVRPEIAVNPTELVARRRKSPAEAALRAPEIANATPPAGPLDIVPNPRVEVRPPLPIAPSAIHAVRATSPRTAAAPVPPLANASPAAAQLALAGGPSAAPQPPLPPTPNTVRAERETNTTASAAAPDVRLASHRLVALSLSPGNAPAPPGNASAPMSIGPHVAKKVSAAAPDLNAGEGAGAGAPGIPSASAAAPGPAGLLILHDSSGPAKPPEPPPASAPPKISPIAPASLRSLTTLSPAGKPASMNRVVRQDLAHRILGPWRIHTLLMNLPNLTSSSGSWVLNFAEPLTARVRKEHNIIAPLPVHAVDPGYPPFLKEEGIEGKVILYAVIDRDGAVTQIRVVQSLDPVLDHNAEVAFSQWKFEPALLHDQPIDLKVIVTVPFTYSKSPE